MNFACPKCQLKLRPKKTGVALEAMSTWGSYQLWMADLWHCPGCGLEIAAGFGSAGQQPVAEHWQPDYEDKLALYKPAARFWANEQERKRYEEQEQQWRAQATK